MLEKRWRRFQVDEKRRARKHRAHAFFTESVLRRRLGAALRRLPERARHNGLMQPTAAASVLSSHEFGVFKREPLHAGVAEVHLHARIVAAPFGVDDDADAELRMAHALADAP